MTLFVVSSRANASARNHSRRLVFVNSGKMSTARSSMSFSASVLWRVKIPQGEMDMSTWWTAVIGRDGPVHAAREVRDSILKPVVGNLHHVSCTPTHPRVSTAHAHTQT